MQGKGPSRHIDIRQRVSAIAQRVDFEWIERAVQGVDELVVMVRRNIQKVGALDAMIIKLRNGLQLAGTL
jgi:hypothetical protein